MPKGRKGIGPPVVADDQSFTEMQEQPTNAVAEPREPREREARSGTPAKRLTFPIDDKGKVMWDSMRATTKDEVRKVVSDMLRDRELAASFGIDKPLVEVFPVEWTGALYDALGQFEVALAPKFFGVSHEVAAAVFPFTAAEKEKLAKPTSAVINKYAADWLIRFKEEIALIMLLASITYAKVLAAKMAQQMLTMKANAAARPNGAEKHEEAAA